ncbi:hypothetical protein H4CHR_01920 [Variovorax sp. PBS-H4]|uniref:CesT family type III secretion system chaperone n=1 Tax=Variovorax sp. PBS-H4 TaxID=434008 RepID=UPI001317DB8E|nr:CesT family type III secretion system chaperone [Variovorax sp. PBS-H4]VTU27069.1 hypothetical protein H4CHR_01920 [Variovorax sp. PBS-H4]
MNSDFDSTPGRAAREQVIALLSLLPGQLGGTWSLDDASYPDWPAWRAAEELAVTLRIGTREFTLLHSLDAERSARLVVECRYGTVPQFSLIECYRQLLARNHRNFPEHPSTYALDSSTKTVVHITSYLLESIDAEKLANVLVDGAQLAMRWQEEFDQASEALQNESSFPFTLQI